MRRLSKVQGETLFLAGRHSRLWEMRKLIRIGVEFWRGFWNLHGLGPAVTVFGSARFAQDHPYCALASQIGRALARAGFTVITGGGPGIMEAANRGAWEAGGFSVGCNILVPHEQRPNRYLHRVVTFYYFFARKVMLVKYSYAFIIMPGGMGTLDEMSEALTLIQTGRLYDFPVILVGKDYWKGFLDWLNNTPLARGTISAEDLALMRVTDSPDEIVSIIQSLCGQLGVSLKPLAK